MRKFLHQNWVEIVAVFGIILGIIVVYQPFRLRRLFNQFVRFFQNQLSDHVNTYANRITPADLVGLLHAVLLLDEIEKAHPDLFNVLLQVMDHATLTDNNGRKADFRQVVLIMTSNAGSRELSTTSIGFAEASGSAHGLEARQKAAEQRSRQGIEKVFSPEFRNRLDAIVSFRPVTPGVMETIVEKFILQLEAQLAERRIAFTLQAEARTWLAEKGYDPIYGARPLARVIQTEVRDPLTHEPRLCRDWHGSHAQVDTAAESRSHRLAGAIPPDAPLLPGGEPCRPEECTCGAVGGCEREGSLQGSV